MKHTIDTTDTTDHELVVDGKIFKEHFNAVANNVSEKKSTLIYRRQIENSYYEVSQDLINGQLNHKSKNEKTNLKDKEQIAEFEVEWKARFKPNIGSIRQPNEGMIVATPQRASVPIQKKKLFCTKSVPPSRISLLSRFYPNHKTFNDKK